MQQPTPKLMHIWGTRFQHVQSTPTITQHYYATLIKAASAGSGETHHSLLVFIMPAFCS
jgi:hypothetical protein